MCCACVVTVAACATGNYCITNAADHISRGDADLMLAGEQGKKMYCLLVQDITLVLPCAEQ